MDQKKFNCFNIISKSRLFHSTVKFYKFCSQWKLRNDNVQHDMEYVTSKVAFLSIMQPFKVMLPLKKNFIGVCFACLSYKCFCFMLQVNLNKEDWIRFLELHQTNNCSEKVDVFNPTHSFPPGQNSASNIGLITSSLLDVATVQTGSLRSSPSLHVGLPDSVVLFRNPIVEIQNQTFEVLESDEEAADFELKTYSVSAKNNSTTNFTFDGPLLLTDLHDSGMQIDKRFCETEDEEDEEFELKTYTLKEKDYNASDHPLSITEKEPLFSDGPSARNEDDVNTNFPGYLKKN